jgi:hypothetical protein
MKFIDSLEMVLPQYFNTVADAVNLHLEHLKNDETVSDIAVTSLH